DLIALNISGEQINEIKKSLPELALKRKRRFVKDYGLSEYDAGILTSSQEEANCFEEAVKKHNAPAKTAANLIINRKSWSLDKEGISIKEINPSRLAELASALDSGKISAGAAKGDIFVSVFKESRPVKEVLAQKETSPIDDVSQLKVWAKEAIIANPKAAVDFSAGNEKAIGPMVGAVMKKSGGRASPAVLNIIFKELLKK
ncbi:MAG: hypothetical protein NTW04_02640, partial [Elusimicrobia bacterium]|nr:hypothetical protein [Elusimicrobiota bacterium]